MSPIRPLGQTNLNSESFDYIIREADFSLSLWKRKKMKEIQSPELLKPCCDKEGDRGDPRAKDGWHCLPVLLLHLYNEPCLKPDVYETSQLRFYLSQFTSKFLPGDG